MLAPLRYAQHLNSNLTEFLHPELALPFHRQRRTRPLFSPDRLSGPSRALPCNALSEDLGVRAHLLICCRPSVLTLQEDSSCPALSSGSCAGCGRRSKRTNTP